MPNNDEHSRFLYWKEIFRIIQYLIIGTVIVVLAYIFLEIARTFSGKETLVDSSFSFFTSNFGLPWGVAILLV